MMNHESGFGIYVGVDTHAETHHAALIDMTGLPVDDRAFAATDVGYDQLAAWAEAAGPVRGCAVEGSNSYGAGLKRVLRARGWLVAETTPGDQADRRLRGKTDQLDAFTAARAALSGRASAVAKAGDGPAEAIRILQARRRILVRHQTQLINQARGLLVTAPERLRQAHRGLSAPRLARRLAASEPVNGTDPVEEVMVEVLRETGRDWLELRSRSTQLSCQIQTIAQAHAPNLMAIRGVGPDVAARLLCAVGDNPERIRSEAALAHLFGIAPIQASSGANHRHRLDRGGIRAGNCAVHRIVLVRMAHDQDTRDYIERCIARGKTKREAIRLLKRHIVRELYPALTR